MKIKADIIFRQVGDSAVLVDLTTNQVFELNGTGYRIWELLAQGFDCQAITRSLTAEFAVEPHIAEKEVEELLAALKREQLIVSE